MGDSLESPLKSVNINDARHKRGLSSQDLYQSGSKARALERYAREPQYAAQLAEAGRVRVMERFTAEHVAGQFYEVYQRVSAR